MGTVSQLQRRTTTDPTHHLGLREVIRVIARAGSGKTTHLINATKQFLETGAPASSLLGVTFTRDAAREIQERLGIKKIPIRGLEPSMPLPSATCERPATILLMRN